MRCTQCNAEFEGQLQHCPSCLTASSNELVQACINCKHELQPSFKLCPQCGEPTQQESTFVITCPNIKDEKICGRPLKPSMKFCGGCRWKINTLIFIPGNKVCGTHTENEAVCINIIETDEDFCTECGTEVKRGMDTDDVEMEDISVEVETNLATKQRDHLVAAESAQKNNIIINKDVNMQEDKSTGEQVQNTKINDDQSILLGNTGVTNFQLEDGKKIEITNNPGPVDGTSTHISQIRLQKPFQDQTEDIQINMEISRSSLDIAGSVDPAGDGNGNVNSSCLLETNSKDNTSSSDKSSNSRTEDGSTDKALQPTLFANRAYVLQANESGTKYTDESDSESDQTHPSSTADPTASELSAPESKKNRGIKKNEKEQYEKQKEREYEKEKNKQKGTLKEIDAEPFLKTTENTIHSNSATSNEENGTISNRETENQGINPGSKADGKKIQEVKNESEDTEKMDRQRGSDSNESEEKHENKAVAGRSHRSQETVEVNFHAIASKLFMPKPEKSIIYIRIHHEQFGNGDLRYPMEMKRKVENDAYEVYASITVPKFMLRNGRAIYYRYTVVEEENTKEKRDEFYYTKNKNKHPRSLSLPQDRANNDLECWHQFDGVIRNKPDKSTLKKFADFIFMRSYEDELSKDVKIIITTFLPERCRLSETKEGFTCSPKECFDVMTMLISGIHRNYFQTTHIWYKYDDMTKTIGKVIASYLRKKTKWSEIESGDCNDFNSAVCVLLLFYKLKIELSEKEMIGMCKCLHINIDPTKRRCPTWETFLQHFEDLKREIKPALRNLLKVGRRTTDPGWLHCIPFWHFLSEKCKPFDEIPKNCEHNAHTPTWWGISDLKDEIQFFKGKTTWEVSELETAKALHPTFVADYLMPRTFVAALSFEGLQEIVKANLFPPEILLAALFYYLKTQHYLSTETEQSLISSLHHLNDQIQDYQQQAEKSSGDSSLFNRSFICQKIGYDVTLLCLENYQYKDLVCQIITSYMLTLTFFDCCITQRDGDFNGEDEKAFTSHLDTIREKVLYWLKEKHSHFFHARNDLKIWSNVLSASLKVTRDDIKDNWKTEMLKTLEDILIEKCMEKDLMKLYCTDLDEFSKDVQAILSRVTFKALEKGVILKLDHMNYDQALEYGKMLSQLFEKNWPEHDTTTAVLKLTLTWSPLIDFLQIFHGDVDKLQVLSQECQSHLSKAANVLANVYQTMISGQIKKGEFSVVNDSLDVFIAICKNLGIIGNEEQQSERHLKKLVQIRDTEFKTIEEMHGHVTNLIALCQHFEVDTQRLDQVMESLQTIADVPLSSLCVPGDITRILTLENYAPEVFLFELSREELENCKRLSRDCMSNTFLNIWISHGKRASAGANKRLTMAEVFSLVMGPAYEEWECLVEQLRHGKIRFSDFKKHFKQSDYTLIENELRKMSFDGNIEWISERLKQIKQHSNIRQCSRGAEVILQVVDKYGLTGDFRKMRQILRLNQGEDTEIGEIDDSLMNACSTLEGMNEEKIYSLEMFIKCKPLVEWLRSAMETGLKELKVFVELASISAGEGDMEVAKVNLLHSATTGYAPLIFNLDETCDSKIFLEKCQVVWRELESDPKLPKKLEDVLRQLEWLKTVRKAHGSVEISSMRQAEAINSKGIYCVGKLHKFRNVQNQKMSIDEVLQLMVHEEEEGKQLKREYQYKELNELQSKLMLVAGKAEQGKADVDKFTMVYDSIIRLCKVFIKLTAAGCVLFKDWHVQFLCEPTRKVCAFIKFGHGHTCKQLKGRRSEYNDIDKIVPRLARFLEKCLDEWMTYIDRKREEYIYLNHFTIDQLVILQKELVKLSKDTEPSKFIYPLLCAVKKNCTKVDLIAAMRLAKTDVSMMENVRQSQAEDDKGITKTVRETNEEVIDFIREMEKMGYRKEVALAALEFCKPDEFDEGLVWCMEHDSEIAVSQTHFSDDTDLSVNVQTEEMFTGWTVSTQSVFSVTQDILQSVFEHEDMCHPDEDPLIKSLQTVWEKFLYSVSSSVSDYLSVEHLGLILRKLAATENVLVKRTLMNCFETSQPNLLVCPHDDVLNTVLTIYASDQNQPLPQSHEVLLCTPQTTLDEVDIFWRRALFNSQGYIHCLVNGDRLDYEVSDIGEKLLEAYMIKAKDKGFQYKLIVICSSEQEYRSRMVAALDRYKRDPLPLLRDDEIRGYMLDKFQNRNRNIAAAAIDFERSSVRVVKSWRAGVGKSLYKVRMSEEVRKMKTANIHSEQVISLPLHERKINIDDIAKKLRKHTLPAGCMEPRLFHIDIYHEVEEGLDTFLFQLLVLGCLADSSGFVWIKLPCDLYVIETIPVLDKEKSIQKGHRKCMHRCFDILPDVVCRSPTESLEIMMGVNQPEDFSPHDLLFDEKEFKSAVFQRPFQYLVRLDSERGIADVNPGQPEGDRKQCLQMLLRHCGVKDPSWSELKHFVWFLNNQLLDFEISAFCSSAAVEDLPGFAKFVLRFLIQMSRDFATRSLNMSEESPKQLMKNGDQQAGDRILELYQLRRTWESSPHPYLFFNPDHHSMTFMGFTINPKSGDLIDQQTKQPLERGIMNKNLFDALHRNNVNLNEEFDCLPRDNKIEKLCSVMGIEDPHDPDDTYELTTDNVKKMLAIYMRFRCDIPVIIMGETGCGKTRLIKFMCSLQSPPGVEAKNMVLMKVHGGTTSADIVRKVHQAEIIAKENTEQINRRMYTVLFFDEANTTEAIGIIKEIMCDRTINGEPLKLSNNLKIVAACNPYRKHSEQLIRRLEQAGLGYHVDSDKTTDKMGCVPMRRLVYRVQPLPQSMLPLVWDFGQLNTDVEEIYIKQMVLRNVKRGRLPSVAGIEKTISKILTVSQNFMRQLKDECSFVSLRDVERVLDVMSWFFNQRTGNRVTPLYKLMDGMQPYDSADEDDITEPGEHRIDDVTRSLLLALGVCYHACLKKREQYRKAVCPHFIGSLHIPGKDITEKAEKMLEEIVRCQNTFLDNVQLGQNIARNQALRENVFMMVVCVELRIPLFLVGKPGSSKSLAKTIVADAMQGNAAHTELFKSYKQVQMVSFQCSPLSVPEGIVGTFRQCARYQMEKDLRRFVSVVILDEIGLAEDSPKMPLKTLHPLLEDGCQGDEEPAPHKKVAFIGISNWALDPAKMNRGILVQREIPDLRELVESAEGICSEKRQVLTLIQHLVEPMAKSYLQLFEKVLEKREFFGLRDFYSLLKMVYGFADAHQRMPSWKMLKHAILRNFGGFEGVDPVKEFKKNFASVKMKDKLPIDPDCSPSGLIQACLQGNQNSEGRYLLLLTENYGALSVLQQKIHSMKNAITIFGSSFPSDQEYTQVCRNINRIKVCMETGKTVVLLNLENLYESLYDALNQYYVYFGGERYVDLGLGTHRVKCRVHKDFRLIVVAEKEMVYDKFPIPLINRLEKHFLTITNMLDDEQLKMTAQLEKWAGDFVNATNPLFQNANRKKQASLKVEEVFMGFHADTCASIILHVCNKTGIGTQGMIAFASELLEDAKRVLLWCATPDSVLRLKDTKIHAEAEKLANIYFKEQKHDSLIHYLASQMGRKKLEEYTEMESTFVQVTTNSKLLSTADIGEIAHYLSLPKTNITILNLQSFDTEQQFCRQVRANLDQRIKEESLLIVQCDSGDKHAALIACARYSAYDELQKMESSINGSIFIVFIVQLPSIAAGNFNGFQCGLWHSIHLDELRPQESNIPSIMDMRNKSVASLMKVSGKKKENEESAVNSDDWQTGNLNFVPTDTDDTVEDLIIMDKHLNAGQVPVEKHFDIGMLLRACVQPSLAMVKDIDSNSTRSTERVKLLLEMIHEKGDHRFLDGLCNHLAALMRERENKLGHGVSDWLTKEAAKPVNIKRAGTFRKALKQCLIDKMTPVLAGLIAFIDTNMNLDILSQGKPWKQNLWLQMFTDTKSTGIEYDGMLSPGKQEELSEIFVKGTNNDGMMFAARMPFSWLIYDTVNEFDRVADKIYNNEHALEEIERLASIVNAHPIGQKLSSLTGQTCLESVKAYLSDFVYMVYPVKSDGEHQFVCESILSACQQLRGMNMNNMVDAVTAIHVTFRIFSTRLRYFSEVNRVWPDCCSKLKTVQQSDTQFYLITDDELTLDVLGLHLLLENLEPERDALNGKLGRAIWLQKVHLYRPVVERILGNFKYNGEINDISYILGNRCKEGVKRARMLWSRVVLVKLFIEYVCASDQQDVKRIMPLWMMFKDGADMKTVTALNKVERVLIVLNKETVHNIYGKQGKCQSCETEITQRPVQLPCKDIICNRCYEEQMMIKSEECPVCNSTIPSGFIPSSDDSERKIADRKYMEYRKRCNTFFIEIVSQLCFSEDTAPDPQVIEKLMTYIIRQSVKETGRVFTKEMTVFDDGLDPTPVFRSFLLQLLIKSSSEQVDTYLDQYFLQATKIIRSAPGETNQQLTELALLILQCLEESLRREIVKSSDAKSEEVRQATRALRENKHNIMVEGLHMNKLYSLAEVRFGLTVVAKYLHMNVSEQSVHMKENVRKMMDAAATLFDNCGLNLPKLFLIKQLCRSYGTERYYAVCQHSGPAVARWMTMPELSSKDKVLECPDRFIVHGNVYAQIRDKLTQTLLTQDVEVFEEFLQTHHIQDWEVRVYLLLALFKEVTMINIHPDHKRRISPEIADMVVSRLTKLPLLQGQELLMKMLTSKSPWSQLETLRITEKMDLSLQNIVTLLMHFFIVILQLPSNNSFTEPLRCLAVQPQEMKPTFNDDIDAPKPTFYVQNGKGQVQKSVTMAIMPLSNQNFQCSQMRDVAHGPLVMENALLPTMQQDDVAEIHEALLAARTDHPNENPVLYRCPNGHPYIIGDCGRPATVGRCKECHKEIGGTGYNLKIGNIQDQGLDHTQTGHILGPPEHRSTNPAPERTMSSSQCAIVRLLTHLAMFTGASRNPQALCELVKPTIHPLKVSNFLYSHICVDLQCIQNALGCNPDDVYLLLHYILCVLHTRHHQYENQRPDVLNLHSKEGRSTWEMGFVRLYLDDTLKNKDSVLQKLNKNIMEDKRLGSDPLLCLLFEKNEPTQALSAMELHNHPAVWRYRTEISMKHLEHQFLTQKTPASFPILNHFLQEDQHLRAIRYIPSIMKLQRLLIHRYQRKLDRAEANRMLIKSILEEKDGNVLEIRQLLQDFMEAWECVRAKLVNFNVPVDNTKMTLHQSHCQPITLQSPLSKLLPTHRDDGLCSYALLYFILQRQNKFLHEYCQLKNLRYDELPVVTLRELSAPHLIMYSQEKDIYPMLLANCSYSFEIGKGTKIEYNFHDFERQLSDRFFFSKSVINISVGEFDLMVYRSESTNAVSFKNLRGRIRQEQLTPGVKNQINEEFHTYEKICESLDRLDIAISFLKSDNVDPETQIDLYLSQILQLEHSFPGRKVKQHCNCKHVQSLWLTLSQLKTMYQALYKQEPFENISSEFKRDLTDVQKCMVERSTEDLIPERLAVILDILFECIELTISIPQNPDDEDYMDMTKLSLQDVLIGHLTSLPYEGYVEYQHQNWIDEMIGQILGNMDGELGILTEQSVNMWSMLYAIYTQKISGR